MRRRMLLIAWMLLTASLLSGCHPLVTDEVEEIDIYATVYPIYALTDALMDGIPNARLHCLVQPQDGCLRSYELSDWDIYLLASSADAVVAGGRGLEGFESTLFSWGEDGPAVSALLYNLELYNQGVSHAQGENDSHLDGANPHLYMSVDGAKRMIESAAAMLMTLDPEYEQKYLENESAALEALDGLSAKIEADSAAVRGKRVILMNEALIYTAQDHGLEIAEWIDRESGVGLYDAELEACLAQLEASGAKVILIESQAPKALTDALETAGYAVARIDILSTHREGQGFESYIQAQLANADAIRRAFDLANHSEEVIE